MNQRNALLKFFEKTSDEFDGYPVLRYDGAGVNLIHLLQTDEESVTYENIDQYIEEKVGIKPDLLIFCTKHQSKSGIHSLSCHTQGNWTTADYGGKPKHVAPCPVRFLNDAYLLMQKLNKDKKLGYEVILEATHHGPYVETPSAWIEIGSDKESWKREDAGIILAEVLVDILPDFTFEFQEEKPVALGIGGLHHCPEFTKRIERFEAYISHVCPKYIEGLTEEALENAINNSIPEIDMIIYDWKSMMKDKEQVIPIVERLAEKYGLEIKKSKDFK